MPIDIHDKDALITAAYAADKPVAFIVGSSLSYDAGGGVPGIEKIKGARPVINMYCFCVLPRVQLRKAVFVRFGFSRQSNTRHISIWSPLIL